MTVKELKALVVEKLGERAELQSDGSNHVLVSWRRKGARNEDQLELRTQNARDKLPGLLDSLAEG